MAARATTPTKSETPAETTAPVETAAPAATPAATTAPAETVPTKSIRFSAEELTKIKSALPWKDHKDGATISGTIVTVIKRTGEFGPYPCVILNTGVERYTAVHAFHGVLQNELKEMNARPGDKVTILYTGKRTANKLNKDGSEKNYHGYSVVPTDGGELEVFDF